LAAHRIRTPADPGKLVRVCEKGKHATPRPTGSGAGYDWDATDAEFDFWHSLGPPDKGELLEAADDGCFLCALDRLMLTRAGAADSEAVWVATESPRRYRKMIGSTSGIRMCTLCYEEQMRIIYGEYEVEFADAGGKILVCQSHKNRLEAEGGIRKGD
jgi:hypothetical protein